MQLFYRFIQLRSRSRVRFASAPSAPLAAY